MNTRHLHSTFTLNILAQHSCSASALNMHIDKGFSIDRPTRQPIGYVIPPQMTLQTSATTTRFKHRAECVCRGASRQCSADRGIACSATYAASSPASVSRSAVLYGVLGRVRTNAIKLFLCDAACVDEKLTIAFSLHFHC